MSDIKTNVDKVFSLYERWGYYQYEGEPVTQLQHALQAAQQAEDANACTSVILGALLHDVRHLVGLNSKIEEKRSLKNHGEVGKAFLGDHGFPDDVTDVVAGHVNAKRYLTFKNPDYYDQLSSHSKYTLELQGGPMCKEEAKSFENLPKFSAIIKVRQWDEKAKSEDMKTRPLEYYKDMSHSYLQSLLR